MPKIKLVTTVNAPVEVCFDLSLSIDFHAYCLRHTGETVVGEKTTGFLVLDEQVTWRAKHFIWQELTSRITAYNRPHYFRDSMVKGAFKRFDHDHFFAPGQNEDCTVITDEFDFESPLGLLGEWANQLFLTKYMTKMLRAKNQQFKEGVENMESRTSFLSRL